MISNSRMQHYSTYDSAEMVHCVQHEYALNYLYIYTSLHTALWLLRAIKPAPRTGTWNRCYAKHPVSRIKINMVKPRGCEHTEQGDLYHMRPNLERPVPTINDRRRWMTHAFLPEHQPVKSSYDNLSVVVASMVPPVPARTAESLSARRVVRAAVGGWRSVVPGWQPCSTRVRHGAAGWRDHMLSLSLPLTLVGITRTAIPVPYL